MIVKKFRSREAKLALLRDIGKPSLKKIGFPMLSGLIIFSLGMALLVFVGFYSKDTSLRSLIPPILLVVTGLMDLIGVFVADLYQRIKKLTDFLAEEIETKKLDA